MTSTVLTRLPWGTPRQHTCWSDVAEPQLLVLVVFTITQGR